MPSPAGPWFRILWFRILLLRVLPLLLAAAIVIAVCLLFWGANLLIASEPAPGHVDAAIILQGSIVSEKARIAGAMNLVRRGVADRVLLSVPKESYWGQSVPPVARAYLEHTYGKDLAARIDFCEISGEVDSTAQEARALRPCIQEHHWQSVVIVTSNYHTRRAGMLWKRTNRSDPKIHMWVEGVADPEFQQPWWRHRQSAKIWLMETSKLVWSVLGGR
jgi:uncharacterized SAM-binding protein YcdF (DUF218 family)